MTWGCIASTRKHIKKLQAGFDNSRKTDQKISAVSKRTSSLFAAMQGMNFRPAYALSA